MASALQNGTYKADSGFVLTITSSDGPTSVFEGTYEALGTPHGKFKVPVIGRFYYVGNTLSIFNISFLAVARPSPSWTYCVADTWAGVVQGSAFTANGVRAWTSEDGKHATENLGQHTFAM